MVGTVQGAGMTDPVAVSYTRLCPGGAIARHVCVDDDVIFDVDWTGRPAGVETIGNDADWMASLARLLMAGEVRLARSIGQGPELDVMRAGRNPA
jgi:hypothetical protein